MNLFLLYFIIQLAALYAMILFSDYLKSMASRSKVVRRPAKVRVRKP